MNRRDLEKMLGAVQEVLSGVDAASSQDPEDSVRTMIQSVNRALHHVTAPDGRTPPQPPPTPPRPTPPPAAVDVDVCIQRAVQQFHGRAPTTEDVARLRPTALQCISRGNSEQQVVTTLIVALQTMQPPPAAQPRPPQPPPVDVRPPPSPPPPGTGPEPITQRRIHFRKDPP